MKLRERRWQRGLRVALLVSFGIVAAACGSSSSTPTTTGASSTTASSTTATSSAAGATTTLPASPLTGGITGFGATLAQWATTHAKVAEKVAGASGASYWGAKTTSASVFTHQFVVLQTVKTRVIALAINFPSGTSLTTAEKETYSQLPSDKSQTFKEILQNDSNGNSCLLLNVTSPTLGAILAASPFDDPSGNVGIEFATVLSAASLGYSPTNINSAFLQLKPNNTSSDC